MVHDNAQPLTGEEQRALINHTLVQQFAALRHMYAQAAEEAKLEREWQNFQDWQSWYELDEETKDSLRACLKQDKA